MKKIQLVGLIAFLSIATLSTEALSFNIADYKKEHYTPFMTGLDEALTKATKTHLDNSNLKPGSPEWIKRIELSYEYHPELNTLQRVVEGEETEKLLFIYNITKEESLLLPLAAYLQGKKDCEDMLKNITESQK